MVALPADGEFCFLFQFQAVKTTDSAGMLILSSLSSTFLNPPPPSPSLFLGHKEANLVPEGPKYFSGLQLRKKSRSTIVLHFQ